MQVFLWLVILLVLFSTILRRDFSKGSDPIFIKLLYTTEHFQNHFSVQALETQSYLSFPWAVACLTQGCTRGIPGLPAEGVQTAESLPLGGFGGGFSDAVGGSGGLVIAIATPGAAHKFQGD